MLSGLFDSPALVVAVAAPDAVDSISSCGYRQSFKWTASTAHWLRTGAPTRRGWAEL